VKDFDWKSQWTSDDSSQLQRALAAAPSDEMKRFKIEDSEPLDPELSGCEIYFTPYVPLDTDITLNEDLDTMVAGS
jgi:hypothetical protein